MIYSGDLFPQWKGDAFIGGLSSTALMIGLIWLAAGVVWLAVVTHGFRRSTPVLDMKE